MHSATLICSALGFLALVMAIPTIQPRQGQAVEKATKDSSNGIQLSIQDLPSCQEAHLNLNANDTTVKSTSCYLNATTSDEKSDVGLITEAVNGPYCANEGTAPGVIDATTLCEYIPTTYGLPPAYSSTTCACETWSLGTALFAFCNCDTCNGILDATLGAICEDIYDDCILNDYTRGYMSQNSPSAFYTLWGAGSTGLGISPVYTGC